ncbi:MAG TPA: alpha/beta fold hydrolase [Solirubrobacteraceae bacterium]|nr:alpha/beta fold hydrolase [Solirubrobacteraceae bacterium]
MPHAETPEVRLHYVRRGSGEPLLLIMGMSGSHLHWGEPFVADLARDFDVIAYDHRGIGASSRMEAPFTIVDLAEDAAALLDALEIESAHVVGISMGGMVAQELVLRHPDRVRTLVLGCTYAGGEGSSLTGQDVVEQLGASMLSGDRERAIRTGWEVNVSPGFAARDDAYAVFAQIGRELPAAVPVIMAQAQAVAGHDTSARLSEIGVPTLVIHGTEDRMLPASNGDAIAARIPGARLEIFDGVGHLFFWEQPERSAALVRELAGATARAQ